MSREISIAIDMDDVLADTTEKLVAIYNRLYNCNYVSEDLVGSDLEKLLSKEVMVDMYQEFNKPGFTRDLIVKPHASQVVEELNQQYKIYIATAAMEVPGTFNDKYDWLKEHFPFLDQNYFIFCGNKRVVQADYLIDDNLQQLKDFQGTGILYTAKGNEEQKTSFVRVNGWMDVRTHFIDQYDRLSEKRSQSDFIQRSSRTK